MALVGPMSAFGNPFLGQWKGQGTAAFVSASSKKAANANYPVEVQATSGQKQFKVKTVLTFPGRVETLTWFGALKENKLEFSIQVYFDEKAAKKKIDAGYGYCIDADKRYCHIVVDAKAAKSPYKYHETIVINENLMTRSGTREKDEVRTSFWKERFVKLK